MENNEKASPSQRDEVDIAVSDGLTDLGNRRRSLPPFSLTTETFRQRSI